MSNAEFLITFLTLAKWLGFFTAVCLLLALMGMAILWVLDKMGCKS